MSLVFEQPEMVPRKKELTEVVVLFVSKYRISNNILPNEQLNHKQVEEILDGVRSLIYQYEELKPRNKI